jgi:carboxylesterase
MNFKARKPETFLFEGNKEIGILLIHGFTGTTAELRPMGEFLHAEGYTVHAPLLKGHGVTPEEMLCTTWVDWFTSARKGYEKLKDRGCEQIVVIGLSMGGLLTLKMAQLHDVLGMVTLCAPIKVRDRRMGMVRYLQHVMPYISRGGQKEEHIEKELFIYNRTPLSCIASLGKLMQNVSYVIPHLTQPILVVQSEKDETVDPCSGQLIYEQIGSKEKELAIFTDSGHIITLDKEREQLFKRITHFIKKLEKNKMYSL